MSCMFTRPTWITMHTESPILKVRELEIKSQQKKKLQNFFWLRAPFGEKTFETVIVYAKRDGSGLSQVQ